jgi:hypothetical protein
MAEIKGVDAFIEGTNLTALGMKIVAVPDSIWKNDHPELLTNILASSPDAPNVTMQLTQGKPGYYVFKTREGSVGILELLDVLEVQPSVHSIKIRYKVLER